MLVKCWYRNTLSLLITSIKLTEETLEYLKIVKTHAILQANSKKLYTVAQVFCNNACIVACNNFKGENIQVVMQLSHCVQ